jgi:hypothetical protein
MAKGPGSGATGSGLDLFGRVKALSRMLWRQQKLAESMGGKCERFVDVRWGTLCDEVDWLKAK